MIQTYEELRGVILDRISSKLDFTWTTGKSQELRDQFLYNSLEHMLETARYAVKIGGEIGLEDEDLMLAEIAGLIHDLGYYDKEIFLSDNSRRAYFCGAKEEIPRFTEIMESWYESELSNCFETDSIGREVIEKLILVVGRAAEIIGEIMVDGKSADFVNLDDDEKLVWVIALADAAQMSHPAYAYYLYRLALQSHDQKQYPIPEMYAELLADYGVSERVLNVAKEMLPDMFGSYCIKKLKKNIAIRKGFAAKLEKLEDNSYMRESLGNMMLRIFEKLEPGIDEKHSFADDISDDLPDRVLDRMSSLNVLV